MNLKGWFKSKSTTWLAAVCGVVVGILSIGGIQLRTQLQIMNDREALQNELLPIANEFERQLAARFAELERLRGTVEQRVGRFDAAVRAALPSLPEAWWSDGSTLLSSDVSEVESIGAGAWNARLRSGQLGTIATHVSSAGEEFLMLISPSQDPRARGPSWFGLALDVQGLIDSTGLREPIRSGTAVTIVRADGARTPVYWTTPSPLDRPITLPLRAPGTDWVLLAEPKGGWADTSAVWSGGIFALLLTLTYAVVFLFLAKRPAEMGAELEALDQRLAQKDARLLKLKSTQAQLEAQLKRSVSLDGETGLPKASSFVDLVKDQLSDVRGRSHGSLHVLAIRFPQLDHLTRSLGEDVARELLTTAIARLSEAVLDGAQLGRLGSRELALCKLESDGQTGAELCEVLIESLKERYFVGDHALNLKAVIGCVTSIDGYDHAPELLDRAALAADNAESRNRSWAEYDPSRHKERINMLQLEADLLVAVQQDELRLFYQPLVGVKDGGIQGFEALLRWQHPRLGLIAPDRFLPLAEDTGQLKVITEWLLTTGVAQIKTWLDRHQRPLYVNFNLAPSDLTKEMCRFVLDTIQQQGVPTDSVGVEITETGIVGDFLAASDLIRWLKEKGIRVLLDDFGTGYSSLSYLRDLPFSAVKIDKSFVQHMTSNPKDFGLVTSIVNLSRYMGMECVAEGVETQEQLDLVEMTDCGYWQGYLCSKPVSAEQAEQLLVAVTVPAEAATAG